MSEKTCTSLDSLGWHVACVYQLKFTLKTYEKQYKHISVILNLLFATVTVILKALSR